jgi:hypothetical protein
MIVHRPRTDDVAGPRDSWYDARRLGGLRRFALAITVFNVLGHTWFGFEQSWVQPFVGVGTAYLMEALLELLDCWTARRRPRFLGSLRQFVDFFLAAHISGMACSMLLYSSERVGPVAFAAAMAIGSKHVLRMQVGPALRHVFNPSNLGIATTLLVFPWVGVTPPYHFTENLHGAGDWILPGFIVVSGTFLNARYTRRLPLIAAWLTGFAAQAVLRHWLLDASLAAALLPMTGVTFILFTFYMITDPPTTPASVPGQIAFGWTVAAAYGALMAAHVVFGLFFALALASSVRAALLFVQQRREARAAPLAEVKATSAAARELAPAGV